MRPTSRSQSSCTSTFNTSLERGAIIAAGRELVASKALFIKKKKYACLIYDLEGQRLDVGNSPGKLKAMGLDLKRADTPEAMQNFLKRILMDVLKALKRSKSSRRSPTSGSNSRSGSRGRRARPRSATSCLLQCTAGPAAQGTSLEGHTKEKKKMIPGHVEASLNWNHLLDIYNDKYSQRIVDGSRIVVCKLKPNHLQTGVHRLSGR
jgi:hypothetical protein